MIPLLKVQNLSVHLPNQKKQTPIVHDVSFKIYKGQTVALVGGSGSGKTTLAKSLLHLTQISSGDISIDGITMSSLTKADKKLLPKKIQYVFQDSSSALNPRMNCYQLLEEPLLIHKIKNRDQRKQIIYEILQNIDLEPSYATHFPHQLSGGQKQRIVIGRALTLNPKLLICDEPTAALDVSIQAGVINLLRALQKEKGLSYLFISHNLILVKYIADYILVMHQGAIVEHGTTEELFTNPQHPYTKALLSAIPGFDMKTDPSTKKDSSNCFVHF